MLGSGGREYYELYAVRNKTLVMNFARVDAVLDLHFILKILILGRYAALRLDMKRVLRKTAPRSDHATTIMIYLLI